MIKRIKKLSNMQVNVSSQDLAKKIKTSGNSNEILKTAQNVLEKMKGKWEPVALFQWFDFEIDETNAAGLIHQNQGKSISIKLGRSINFLKQARYVMVCSYTIGQTLDNEAAKASSKGRLLESYIIDLIGVIALEKTGDIVKKKAEDQARNLGWGVGPFLSPGSVHEWVLDDQSKLCALIPIENINMNIQIMVSHLSISTKKISGQCNWVSLR